MDIIYLLYLTDVNKSVGLIDETMKSSQDDKSQDNDCYDNKYYDNDCYDNNYHDNDCLDNECSDKGAYKLMRRINSVRSYLYVSGFFTGEFKLMQPHNYQVIESRWQPLSPNLVKVLYNVVTFPSNRRVI